MRVGWTGQRPDLFADPAAAQARVASLAHELGQRGAERFVVGGQRGVDTWAGLAGIELAVPISLLLPLHLNEFTAEGWSASDRALLQRLVDAADDVQVADGYTDRNRRVATGVDLLVAVWTGLGRGGTAETLDFARAAGTTIRDVRLDASTTAASAYGRGI